MRLVKGQLTRCMSAFLLLCLLMMSACASTGTPEVGTPDETWDKNIWKDETRAAVESLRQAVEAAKDREKDRVDRLHRAEERDRRLERELALLQVQYAELQARIDSLELRPGTPPAPARDRPLRAEHEILTAYQRALQLYRERNFAVALDRFADIISAAPHSEWVDNAQYWRAECFYGMEQYRQALAEFTKVFAYEDTQKGDDAQFKIGRCYLALGERQRALDAFRKLLEEYPQSEYAAMTRQELRYLQD